MAISDTERALIEATITRHAGTLKRLSENDSAIGALLVQSLGLDEQSMAHLVGELVRYVGMTSGEIDQEIAERKDYSERAAYQRLLFAVPVRSLNSNVNPVLSDVAMQIKQLPADYREKLIRIWWDELYFKAEWERLIDETPSEFIELLKPDVPR